MTQAVNLAALARRVLSDGTLMSQRVTNGAIADIRFLSTATNGLAAGSKVLLRKLL